MATNSAFVEEGQPVVAQPKLMSKVEMYQPDPIIAASSVVTLDEIREPSVYMSMDCCEFAFRVMSESLFKSSLQAELSANADLIN